MRRVTLCLPAVATLVLALLTPAFGDTAVWTTWTAQTANSVTGTMTFGAQTVGVTYTGENNTTVTELNGAGTNFFLPSPPTFPTFTSATITNAPPGGNMISIDGTATLHTLTFSVPVTNPVFAVVSLGQPSVHTTYTFSAPFTILSQGAEASFGGCTTCLSVSGDSLVGTEGDGVIQFDGTFSSITWTGANPEFWNGFTVGAVGTGSGTSTVPEPSSLLLMGSGLTGLVGLLRRRK